MGLKPGTLDQSVRRANHCAMLAKQYTLSWAKSVSMSQYIDRRHVLSVSGSVFNHKTFLFCWWLAVWTKWVVYFSLLTPVGGVTSQGNTPVESHQWQQPFHGTLSNAALFFKNSVESVMFLLSKYKALLIYIMLLCDEIGLGVCVHLPTRSDCILFDFEQVRQNVHFF